MTVRVLIVDDHPMIRVGLQAILEGDPRLSVVAVATDGAHALALMEQPDIVVDVVLTDLRMPGMDGVALTTAVTKHYPSVKVLVVTTFETDHDIVRAVEAGATGYLLKDTPQEHLVAAVCAAARGETVLAPSVANRLLSRMRTPAPDGLTPREIDVLRCVAEGLTNADIGRKLHIGESTVKTHLLRTFAKLGVDDRTAAVTTAQRNGML
jgi:DNA-binding NarL/FixJ family response regulator